MPKAPSATLPRVVRSGLVADPSAGGGSAIGRGVTWFVKDESRHLVLRHYYRGGMVGKLVRDRFWFEGVESSRAMAEYRLLAQLSEQGLPVPRPFAARMVKQGPSIAPTS